MTLKTKSLLNTFELFEMYKVIPRSKWFKEPTYYTYFRIESYTRCRLILRFWLWDLICIE